MKVGDYIRTENGINKVAGYRYESEYENGHVVWFEKSDSGCRFTDKNLPKSSPNIIDLIEVGDYVNGCYVDEIIGANDSWDDRQHFHLLKFDSYFGNSDIKSIVTKEQFEAMKYEIK